MKEIDRVVEDYSAQVDTLVWELIAHSQKVIAGLKETQAKLRSEVQSALEEVERTLKEEGPHFSTRLGAALRDLAQCPRTFRLFSYTIQTSPTTDPRLSADTAGQSSRLTPA